MPGVAASIRVFPSINDALRELRLTPDQQKALNDWSLRSITAWCLREIQVAFTSRGQGQPGGEPWKSLSESWAGKKAADGYSPLIGIHKGALRQSLQGSTTPGAIGLAAAVDYKRKGIESQLNVGTGLDYADEFNAIRPILPVESYVTNHWQDIHSGLLKRGRTLGQ